MDSRLLKAKIGDLFDLCDKRNEPQFSAFLDGGEAAVIEEEFRVPYGYNTMLFGGYEDAERKIFGVFPEWEEADEQSFPICVIRFDVPKFRKLTHRDYLGTIMSLGIDRNKTGDILTDDEGAFVMVASDIAEYIKNNATKIANAGVKARIIGISDFTPPPPKTKEKQCVAASLRLDAVVAAVFNISRNAAEKLVKEELVKVNHRTARSRSDQIETGSLISVRGYGRFILKDTGANTQKGRLHITAEIFV